MRMKIAAAAVVMATLAASPVTAAVTYTFENRYQGSILDRFTYVSDDFITTPRQISYTSSALSKCEYYQYYCYSVAFNIDGNASVVTFTGGKTYGSLDYGSSTMARRFGAGAFTAVGTYTNDTGLTTLRVSGAPTVASVPEPTTWAMFIGGFGLVGASLRRRSGRRRLA